MLYYKVTVYLNCGQEFVITTNCLERTILEIEDWYGDALRGYDATKAEDFRITQRC